MLVENDIYKALSTPSLVAGIPSNLAMGLVLLSVILFLVSGSLMGYLIYMPLHIGCWVLYKVDRNIFSVLEASLIEVGATQNKHIFGCNSYEN